MTRQNKQVLKTIRAKQMKSLSTAMYHWKPISSTPMDEECLAYQKYYQEYLAQRIASVFCIPVEWLGEVGYNKEKIV